MNVTNVSKEWKLYENMKILNGCEVWIENSVTKLTVTHHEARGVIQNSYPEWQEFSVCTQQPLWFFFLHTFPSTTAFKLIYVLFYQLRLNIYSLIKKWSVGSYYNVDVERFGRKNSVKN